MKRFLIFVCALFTFGTANAYYLYCPASWYFNGTDCVPCPDGLASAAGATECTPCPINTYFDSSTHTCTDCPSNYPNSAPGATSLKECYSNIKIRDCTDTCVSDGCNMCNNATSCNYVAYAKKGFGYIDGTIQWGCESCDEIKSTYVSAQPGFSTDGTSCEICPAGTYSTGGNTTTCEPCPDGTIAANDGATECIPIDETCHAGTYADVLTGTCVTCPAGTYSMDDATECTPCPDGLASAAGATECTPCPINTYLNSSTHTCTNCPAAYPNSEPGTSDISQCYSNWKTRTCQNLLGCVERNCQYVAYAKMQKQGFKTIYGDGEIKEGCTEEYCLSLSNVVMALPGYRVNGTSCEICPKNTYSTGGENAKCEPCPSGAFTAMDGAVDRAECMRILNYQASNDTTPTKIYLSGIKHTSPALAIGIGDDVLYANMLHVSGRSAPGMYIAHNNKTYKISNNSVFKSDKFYITTTPDTDSFEFTIYAAGNFTVDWGDGNVEMVDYNTCARNNLSHTYDEPGKYTISLSGRATEYCPYKSGFKTVCLSIIFSDKLKIAAIDGSLGAIFSRLPDGTNPNFKGLFSGATNLTGQIPSTLFSGIGGSPTSSMCTGMFQSVFDGCSGLTGEIPVGLFGYLLGDVGSATFQNAFNGCSGLSGPTARNPDGTPLYDIEYDGQTWLEYAPTAFTDMYTGSGISDL